MYAGPAVNAAERASNEAQAGYITRPVLAMDALANDADGRLVVETPPDPKTSIDWIRLSGFTGSHRISLIRDGIIRGSMVHPPSRADSRGTSRCGNGLHGGREASRTGLAYSYSDI